MVEQGFWYVTFTSPPVQNSPTSNPYNSITSSLFTGLRATTNRVHQVVYGFALKKNIGHIVVE